MSKKTQLEKDYLDQIKTMSQRAAQWVKDHPDREVKVQFNYTPKVFLVAAISDAINNHWISTNDAGLELIKSLWRWDVRSEPTAMMVKIALEALPVFKDSL